MCGVDTDTSLARREVLVSVDIEASGPSPSTGSLLSIGACLIEDPEIEFYVELKPLPDRPWDDDAARIHRLDRDALMRDGLAAQAALAEFESWLSEKCGSSGRPIFVGFNAPFDWMFVADYFWRYLGRNPFGISALDLKSYYMGNRAVERWAETSRSHIDQRLGLTRVHSHQALDDARGQAEIARVLMGMDRDGET
jgi:DNA polymerase III epsilon subunit-like protein